LYIYLLFHTIDRETVKSGKNSDRGSVDHVIFGEDDWVISISVVFFQGPGEYKESSFFVTPKPPRFLIKTSNFRSDRPNSLTKPQILRAKGVYMA